MSRSHLARTARLLALLVLLIAPGLRATATQPQGSTVPDPAPISSPPIYQLLTNPNFENYDPPYAEYEGVSCQVASGWQRFWIETAGAEPCWMDDRVFAASHLGTGWVDKIDGETCQLIFSSQPYTGGVFQQVAVTPGTGYAFHAAMLSIFQTSAQPPEHGTMLKRVGIDPAGGTDPRAPGIIWSPADGWDQGPWRVDIRTAAWAQASTMTVFVEVDSALPGGDPSLLNIGFMDSSILAQAPIITATSPANTEVPTFTVSWDNAVPAPGFYRFTGRDVQWLDEAEGVWHDWITNTRQIQGQFGGQWGHTYRFRARIWQKYVNDALMYSPYRPAGDSRTVVAGPRLVGRVLLHDGRPIPGARIALEGTDSATFSGPDGRYELKLEPRAEPGVIAVSHPYWPAPPSLHGVTWGVTTTVPFTWTLRPTHDRVANGGFESGLDGWHTLGLTPTVSSDTVHTGLGALALATLGSAADAMISSTTGITQSMVLTNTWTPALAFWYNPLRAGPGDRFTVSVAVVTETISSSLPVALTRLLTPSLDAVGWQHLVLPLGPPSTALTGTVTLRFELSGTPVKSALSSTLLLDEIALGATAGGPFKAYLPVILRHF